LYQLLLLLVLWLSACSTLPSPSERAEVAELLAAQAGWKKVSIDTDHFTLLAYLPSMIKSTETLTIYIEGDGFAWVNASTPSFDPTPINPLALKLALLDNVPSAYLARPCQFVHEKQRNCSQKYWTSHRFSPEVIHSTSQAIDQIKHQFGAEKLIFVGYSGGGAVAALVAAQRQDVMRLITIAGNLNHQAWTSTHHLSPLVGSLNPADNWQPLQAIAQTHFVGGKDQEMGEFVAQTYAAKYPAALKPNIIVMPDFDHYCCWQAHWPELKNQNSH
jgi:hypothetical protein